MKYKSFEGVDSLKKDEDVSVWSLGAKLSSVYQVYRSPLRLGFNLDYNSLTWKTKQNGRLTEDDAIDVNLAPMANYSWNGLVVESKLRFYLVAGK